MGNDFVIPVTTYNFLLTAGGGGNSLINKSNNPVVYFSTTMDADLEYGRTIPALPDFS